MRTPVESAKDCQLNIVLLRGDRCWLMPSWVTPLC